MSKSVRFYYFGHNSLASSKYSISAPGGGGIAKCLAASDASYLFEATFDHNPTNGESGLAPPYGTCNTEQGGWLKIEETGAEFGTILLKPSSEGLGSTEANNDIVLELRRTSGDGRIAWLGQTETPSGDPAPSAELKLTWP